MITTYSTAQGYLSVNYSALTGYPDAVVNALQIKSGDPAPAPAPVPEPSTAVLLGIGGIFIGIVWRKKQISDNLPDFIHQSL